MRLLFPLLALFLMIPLDAFAGDQATATFLATDGLYCEGMSRQVLDDEALQVAQAVDKGTAKLDNFTRAFKKTCDLEGSLAAASTDKTTDAYLSVYGLYCDGMGRQLHDYDNEPAEIASGVGAGTLDLNDFTKAFKQSCNYKVSREVAKIQPADAKVEAPEAPAANGTAL